MKFLALFVLLAVPALASLASQSGVDVDLGYFAGRSGNVILKPAGVAPSDMSAFVFDNEGRYVKEVSHGSIDTRHMSDLAGRFIGLEPQHAEFNPAFVSSSMFDRPRANVWAVVESVSEEVINKHELSTLRSMRDAAGHVALKVKHASYPSDSLPVSVTVASGSHPHEHGIVGRNWQTSNGQVVAAFSDDSRAQSRVANLADLLSFTFKGKSLALSYSADVQQASAHCAHSSLRARRPEWNVACLSLNEEGLSPIAGPTQRLGEQLSASAEQLAADAATAFVQLPNGVSASIVDGALEINAPGLTAPVRLALEEQVVSRFVNELLGAQRVVSALSTGALQSLAKDAHPDQLTFVLSSLSALAQEKSLESDEFAAAAKLLDAFLGQLLSQISAAYGHRAVSTVMLMGTRPSAARALQKNEAVLPLLKRIAPQAVVSELSLPSVFVPAPTAAVLQDVCERLRSEMQSHSVEVYCPDGATAAMRVHALHFAAQATTSAAALKASNSTSVVTYADVSRYHIVLWLTVGLVLAVAAAAYSIGWMSFKKDTLLYSTFNPNWGEARKTR